MYFIGTEELFMMNRYKLNIEDSYSIMNIDEQAIKDEVLIKGQPGSKNIRFNFPDCGDHNSGSHSRKPSQNTRGGWKEISIDTINLTPKSCRSKTNSPFNYRHHPPHIEQSRLKSPRVNNIFSAFHNPDTKGVSDLDRTFKIEELEA